MKPRTLKVWGRRALAEFLATLTEDGIDTYTVQRIDRNTFTVSFES